MAWARCLQAELEAAVGTTAAIGDVGPLAAVVCLVSCPNGAEHGQHHVVARFQVHHRSTAARSPTLHRWNGVFFIA